MNEEIDRIDHLENIDIWWTKENECRVNKKGRQMSEGKTDERTKLIREVVGKEV